MTQSPRNLPAALLKPIGLAMVCLVAGTLHADLGGRLGVLANALAASDAVKGQLVSVTCVGGEGGGSQDPLGPTLLDGMRQALTAASVPVAPEGSSPSAQGLTLELSVHPLQDGVALKAVLRGASDPAELWSRSARIPSEDLPGVTPGDEAPEGPDTGFDVVPLGPDRPARRRFHWDLSAAYKAFLPWNSTFRSVAGSRLDGLSLGASFQDVLLVDVDAWHANLNGQGTLQSLDYAGVALALVAPLHWGGVTLYAGPGGRFGSINLNDATLPAGSVSFGNNAFEGVAGLKASYGRLGLDLRYGYDFAASYTGYHTVRLGAYYAFGR
jgi:hypothetical protein